MKKSTATTYSPALELPAITRRISRRFQKRKAGRHEPLTLSSTPVPPPPSEEIISRLNRIGQEYPFCVYYKQKVNDPL